MSRFLDPVTGEDHPEAAKKHIEDGEVLFAAGRFDGSSYLYGYAIECSLKTALLVANQPPPKGTSGHDLEGLSRRALGVALSVYGPSQPAVAALPTLISNYDRSGKWVSMRYKPVGSTSATQALESKGLAEDIFLMTIGEFELNGQLK